MVTKNNIPDKEKSLEQTQNLKPYTSDDDEGVEFSQSKKPGFWTKSRISLGIFLLICLVLAITGIILISIASKKPDDTESEAEGAQYSAEAQKAGLVSFLKKVRKREAEGNEVFDPRPDKLKKKTDASLELLRELNNINIDTDKLKLREKKVLVQVKHYLEHTFGLPFGANYYAGDWMLGPNTFCWEEICFNVQYQIRKYLLKYLPTNESNVEKLKEILEGYGKGFNQYVENMKYGVQAGMVRSSVECKDGFTSLQRSYLDIALKGEEGVLELGFVKEFHSIFKEYKGKSSVINGTKVVNDLLVQYIGKPVVNMLNYVEKEHSRHCVPSFISSGLASLPLSYVYVDGIKNTSQSTTKKLPTGEWIYGKESYKMIMPFFTTTNMTPEEVHQLGWKMLQQIYAEVIEFAKNYTKLNDPDAAVAEMKKRLNASDMFFANGFPEEENGEEAHLKCISDETAQKHCPKRWEAMTKWMKLSREVTNLIECKITHLFHFTKEFQSVPSCPVQLVLNFNPASAVQSYRSTTHSCKLPSSYFLPFWTERPGPITTEWSINAHEARPGHHLQLQGLIEHFFDSEDDIISVFDQTTYYTAFSEGWALYAEYPLVALDTDLYESPDAQIFKYGMYNSVIWRAIRLVVDTGLHYYGYKREWALDMFKKYSWETGDVIEKEVTRYQSNFGQATAYMIGQLHIYKLRNYTQEKLGEKFDMEEFHYQVLSQGSAPLEYLQSVIEKYVKCKLQPEEPGCDVILSSPEKRKSHKKVHNNQPEAYPFHHLQHHYY